MKCSLYSKVQYHVVVADFYTQKFFILFLQVIHCMLEVHHVYTHAKRSHTHVKDAVVHVRVWCRLCKHQNNPACTKSARLRVFIMLKLTLYGRRFLDFPFWFFFCGGGGEYSPFFSAYLASQMW